LEHKKFSVAGFKKPLEMMKEKIDEELSRASKAVLFRLGF